MKRPPLRKIALSAVLPLGTSPGIVATMSRHQWDGLLAALYNQGAILLELDRRERPRRAYQRFGADHPVEKGD